MMKILTQFFLIACVLFSGVAQSQTPTQVLQSTVDQLIATITDKQKSEQQQYDKISQIIRDGVDFEYVSKRVVSRPWLEASDVQKQQFIEKFSTILIDTYWKLLKNYSNERVEYGDEAIKKDKYAQVETHVISEGKKIPVVYRLINSDGGWKIYDFIVEGSSLVNSYKNNYQVILNKNGMQGLLEEMNKPKKATEADS